MNLVFLIGRFPPGVTGGAELQAEAWARRLADRHRILVVTRKGSSAEPDREDRDGFAVVRLPVARVPFLRSALDVLATERTVAAIAPPPDLVLAFQTFISGFVAVRLQRRLGTPAVVWVRGEDEYRIERGRTRRVSIGVWRAAAGVLVQSESNRAGVRAALARFGGAAAEAATRIEVVPNGIDLPAEPGPPGRRVLTVARLIPDKGVDVVIEAVARAGMPLTIAGDGPARPALEALARKRGLDARFTGFVNREALAALYREASCLVLASRRGEGLPNVVLEAFAWERPVIATAVPGVTDLVTDGVNGRLVPPGDAAVLAAALAHLRDDPGFAARLARAGRETAAGYAWERVRPRLESLLERWSREAAALGAGR
jgi:glycosyltransferase involved in cell wall biosynthesis